MLPEWHRKASNHLNKIPVLQNRDKTMISEEWFARNFPISPSLAHSCLQLQSSCLPLPGMNSCSRMLRVIAVELQRACFIKHSLLLDFHWCSIILSFQRTRHFFMYLVRRVQGAPHIFVSCWILLLNLFKPGPALDQILPSTAASCVNLVPKSSVAVGLTQPSHSWLYLCTPYSALARIWTGNVTVNWDLGRHSLIHPIVSNREEAGDLKPQNANLKRQKVLVLWRCLGRCW